MTSASSRSSDSRLTRLDWIILALAVLIGAGIYLITSALTYKIGFPLDDSWIHQTYARNLAEYGQWAYRLGVPSAGSTAPLWSALLAIGFWLHLAPYTWAYLLGGLTLWMLAAVGEITARRLLSAYRPRLPWVGLLLAFEWHLLWAAMSGMETLLHALILTVVLAALMMNSRRYLTLGLLTGLSVWVRPDGLTLLGPVLLTIVLTEKDNPARFHAAVKYLIGFGVLFVFYLLFNLMIGGTPMPNTFYAKQAEYASWQSLPILQRLGQLFLQLMVGPAIILLPGAIGWLVTSIRQRVWGALSGMIWFVGYLWLYVSRLPLYQHGRYIMPAMPIFFLWGILALVNFVGSKQFGRYHWFAQTLWQVSAAAVYLLFIVLGARSYGQDVAVIESEMVVTAKWAAVNIPPGAVIAAHDIGALGYFDNHPLIDLAGLISPEVIPFIRDEARLAIYLNGRHANYLIAFPDFYPKLVQQARPVFNSGGIFAPKFGSQNMVIYLWKQP